MVSLAGKADGKCRSACVQVKCNTDEARWQELPHDEDDELVDDRRGKLYICSSS